MAGAFERELIRGSLDMIVMSVLSSEPKYGYSIQKEVVDATHSAVKLPAGTLYPLLHRLESEKLIRSNWQVVNGRRRKYYELTAKGKKQLNKQGEQWSKYAQMMAGILGNALGADSQIQPHPAS